MRTQTPAIDRVMTKIVVHPDTDCWLFQGYKSHAGHGFIGTGGRAGRDVPVHRVTYEALRGVIPRGLELDHLCRRPNCCNPYHVEPVTHQVNMERGMRKRNQTHCLRGHEFTPENTIRLKAPKRTIEGTQRACRQCARIHKDRYRNRLRAEGKRVK